MNLIILTFSKRFCYPTVELNKRTCMLYAKSDASSIHRTRLLDKVRTIKNCIFGTDHVHTIQSSYKIVTVRSVPFCVCLQ
jgi:hypothetical protein